MYDKEKYFHSGMVSIDDRCLPVNLRRSSRSWRNKSRRIPVILVHSPFWQGLLSWFRDTLIPEATINPEDLDLLQILDKPQEVVDAIFNFYEGRGFEPSPEEQQILLDL